MEVKKIKREHFAWGVWDKKEKTFLKMFETKLEAEKYLAGLKKSS
jgi:hypothetical protein